MASGRPPVPQKVRELVLREFNHLCAMCGKPNPQLHHIDRNPENNSESNLIPLCPNHHLLDQHSPTAPFDPKKLELFRMYKDPTILSSQFEPLFRRLRFLPDVESSDLESVRANAVELVAFVSALGMGAYYGEAISACVNPPAQPSFWNTSTTDQELAAMDRGALAHLVTHVVAHRQRAVDLCIELLRYQTWAVDEKARREL